MSNDSSEANRDDALKSLAVARKKLASSDVEGAIRFTKKSISLFDTPTARSLLVELEALQREGGARASSSANGGASEATGSSSGSSARRPAAASSASSSSAREAPGTAASSKPYTAEQAALVKRITKCKVTEYYEILSIDRKAEDVQIKKAYRKLALTLHPDKNGAPGAEDAFKRVSKAFQILSDPQKRSAFDAHGADPDDRSAGMPSFARRGGGGSPFGGRGGQPFGEEVSAEDLFNMFFGGGGGGGFAGNGFSGSPGGIRFQTFGQPQRRRTAAGGQAQAQQPAWVQLLPLIILVLFSLVSFLPSLFFTQPPPDPSYSFERSAFHDLHRQTHTHAKVDYFVNTRQYATHPFFSTLLSANPSRMSFSPTTDDTKSPEYVNQIIETAVTYQDLPEKLSIPRDYLRFEQGVEQSYLQRLQQMCNYEIQHRNERLQQARGFFGVGADWDKVKRIEAEVMQHCSKLRSLGYRV